MYQNIINYRGMKPANNNLKQRSGSQYGVFGTENKNMSTNKWTSERNLLKLQRSHTNKMFGMTKNSMWSDVNA